MLNVKISKLELGSFVLKNIRFNLKRGNVLGLLGANGAGKTTLLKTIAGIYTPVNAEISWKNREIGDYVEYIPPFLDPRLSIETRYFLEASLDRARLTPEDRERIEKIARMMKIEDLLCRDLKVLSSGEISRVLLAKALLRKKPVILWDEPTSFLDLKYRYHLKKLVQKLKRKRILIISSHDLKWIQSIADFYMGIKEGESSFYTSELTPGVIKKLLI
jgi:ABC-type cobalamin/Fe3+-siderophores transport system ATPase subunit